MSEISAPYYFAYGSNMLLSQMKERCPNSMKEWVGMLGGYNLTFPRSSKNGGGVSSIELNEGGVVWGVIFSMTSND